ncbi:winged helix-turn-helix transcriptional regulator [Acholeplasma equirhinis]|uniref:winged helix-turn-helix domain-containing protein n=1 Tax=Acholeplasma equirhinis TaxID=555393 RepID=UPI00197AEBA6|nr:winged helix-turn-helix domain-containing protein [Acholeplasma equirhinis]MBN3489966.1 winged helix-turn-helix transcriptional regulator [Acholeplasma equirhinis]
MDSNHYFLKPTPLLKEYQLLDLIAKNSDITQRELSRNLNVALSMINEYLDKAEQNGYISKNYKSSKDVEYHITNQGKDRIKLLNIRYLKSALDVYTSARGEVSQFLHRVINEGFKKIILYGAGDVTDILLQTLNYDKSLNLEIVAIVDDNKSKQNTKMYGIEILPTSELTKLKHDGVLVSSYLHHDKILEHLKSLNYDQSKIIHFFKD